MKKPVKTLALIATLLGIAALLAAGTASATEMLCGEAMCATGTAISAESEGHAVLDSPIGEIKCNSTVKATTANTGGSGETVSANLSALTFTGCTDGADVTVVSLGSLEFHTIAGTSNATLTSTGTEVTVELFGAHCIFKTNATDLGTATGSATTGSNATLDISARIPHVGGRSGALCGTTSPWTGSYKFTGGMNWG